MPKIGQMALEQICPNIIFLGVERGVGRI